MIKRRKKVLNVTDGGIAFPIAPGYFLMKGRTHEQGGIGIGNNLEVEDGEIIKTNKKSLKVLSNAPIMNGISPAQMALGGLNNGTFEKRFNQGFKYQERFKDKNGLKDDGTKSKYGKNKALIGTEKNDKKLVEDVVRTSGGITGKVLLPKLPFIDFNQLSRGIRAWKVKKGNKNKIAGPDEDYTGVAMKGKGLITDNGLGFVSTNDLINALGEKPVDFVDAFVYGKTPFEKQGVIKKENTPEKHIFRTKLSKMNKEVSVYQTHKDTLDKNIVKMLNDKLSKGNVDIYNENTTYQGSPFEIGNTGIIYDGNNSTIASVTLPDGTIAYKALDVFDTDPNEWNYKIGRFAKKGLKFIHENSNPFLMTTPWYYKVDDRTEEEKLRQIFGIEFDENGNEINYGDYNGNVWTLEDALDWINTHKYNAVPYNKKELGGEKQMKYNKHNVPSTGERKKAKLGLTAGDWITLGSNVLGLIGSTWGSSKALAKQRDYQLPTPYQAAKLKTNININPQLNELRRTVDKYNKFIDRNTASSQVAYNRRLGNELSFFENYNQLYGQKENTETQLINQDRLNQQEIANKYIQDVASIRNLNIDRYNQRLEGYSDINTNLLQGITDIGTSLFNNLEDRKRYKTSLKLIPYMYPEINKEEYNKMLSEIVD